MSESESASKRQRIGQACDHCRKRKSKCDGKQPTCSVCSLFKRNCAYRNAKKRGLPSGYVRGLEALLGLCKQHIPNCEYVIQALIRSSHGGAKFHDTDFLDYTADIWRKSQTARELEHILSIRNDETTQPTTVETADLPPFEMFPRPADQPRTPDALQQNNETTGAQSHGFGKYKELETLSPVIFPENTPDLVDFYFRTTHCWFPIVERRDILRIMCEDNTKNNLSIEDEGHRLCLWAIVAYSTAFREVISDYSGSTNPEHIQIYVRFRLALHHEAYGVGHVQAILIIILLYLIRGHFKAAWMLMAQASGMLRAVEDADAQKSERHRHVWHGCAYIDNLLSMILRKDAFLSHVSNIHLQELDQNGVDEWELWAPPVAEKENGVQRHERKPLRVLSTFNLLTQLMGKLPSIYEGALEADHLEERIKDLQIWYSTLGKHHQLRENSNPPLLTLHLSYNFVLLSFFRENCEIRHHLVPLMEETLHSTYTMLVQYLNLTEISGASGLLICFGFQAQSCLQTCGHLLPTQVHSLLRHRYTLILESLNRHYDDNRNEFVQPGTSQGYYASSTEQNPDVRSGITTSAINHPRTTGNLIVSPGSAAASVPGSDDHGSSGTTTLESTNDFYLDSLYDDMLSIFPTGRYDDEADQFAQNLGFLTNDIDTNPFTFPFTQQKL
ncbi:transcriptional regulator family: Fungal Specific TF [Paecilomyces variotii]|nr:transcriptional regulator family: Fungal Specific TF [Paecilomyces variotii]